jgi:prophage regulatory protein
MSIFFCQEVKMEKRERILRKPELLAKLGLSDASVWRREKMGDFPKRISLGGSSIGWLESEVDGWLQKKADARGKPSGPGNKMECR